MNNPFEYRPSSECQLAFGALVEEIDRLRESSRPEDREFCRELDSGKMLGVLIATDSAGARHVLYAFSGQSGAGGFNRKGFVEPVFDYLHPDGYFKTHEKEISRQNREIRDFENGRLAAVSGEYEALRRKAECMISEFKEQCRRSKLERKYRRENSDLSEEAREEMIRQSQFEKAELHRLKKRNQAILEPFLAKLNDARRQLEDMKAKRKCDSEALQDWLFSNFKLLNWEGESKSLSEIFSETTLKVPPSGAGECCAPKLLQAAFRRGLTPISIAEYWYGGPKGGEVRVHGEHYPACRGKCLPILRWMLKGLPIEPPLERSIVEVPELRPEIIYENEWFCVVNKPSGMLSVPGKGAAISVSRWLEERYGDERDVRPVHRLDQDTSGLLIAAFGLDSFKILQSLFARREVRKTYIADLAGDYLARDLPSRGKIRLPLIPDWLDRPRQRVDFEVGKEAETDYEFIGVKEGRSRVIFHPHTGRTHQLRVHSASDLGLGMPIVGDRLYGDRLNPGDRLHLHARQIEFTFPLDGHIYTFEVPDPF